MTISAHFIVFAITSLHQTKSLGLQTISKVHKHNKKPLKNQYTFAARDRKYNINN